MHAFDVLPVIAHSATPTGWPTAQGGYDLARATVGGHSPLTNGELHPGERDKTMTACVSRAPRAHQPRSQLAWAGQLGAPMR
jgi:hypothetical protein